MNIVIEAEAFVVDFFKKHHTPIFTYHNLEHTKSVVKQSKKIGEESELNEDEIEILLLAAWFHDTGYFENFLDHENISVHIAKQFLKDRNYPEEKISIVQECILHTSFPHQPHGHKIADVLCDADLHHLSAKDYIKTSEKLRDEKISLLHHNISQKVYWEETLGFLKDHCYHTNYGKKVLGKKKEANLQKVIEKVNTYQTKEIKKLNEQVIKLEKQNAKLKAPQRGIETLFRLTARNQINLSSIADSKANLMISVNSIIISAIFFIYRHIDDVPHFIIPSTILLITCLFTIIYSVLATRPNVTTGTFTQEDVAQKKVNLLFFGNFFKMELPDYSKALKGVMTDYDELYESLIKDQYFLGKVLGKKYQLLRISYTIFMYGLILSVLAFILATAFQPVLW